MAMKDYYKVLGLTSNASDEEIRARWAELVKQYHPDVEEEGEVDDRIKEINEAYQVLRGTSARLEYDLERGLERGVRKSRRNRFMVLAGFLIASIVLVCLYFVGPEPKAPISFRPSVKHSQEENSNVRSIPKSHSAPNAGSNHEMASNVQRPPRLSDPKEKSATPKKVDPVALVPGKKPVINKEEPVQLKPVGENTNKVKEVEKKRETIQGTQIQKAVAISSAPVDSKPRSPELRVANDSNPPLVTVDGEVEEFFANYAKVYMQRDIISFLSLFSTKAIQNEREGFDGIKRIYTRFFNQSEELRYRMQDLKVEKYQNAVEARATYEIDQVLRRGGEKKCWRGNIRWILSRENGTLKIISVNYQHQKSL